MSRRVVISGLGPVSGAGIGQTALWQAMLEGRSAIAPIMAFDPGGFDCTLGCEVKDFKISTYVPKSYRKATKVMARDIELAVAAADLAARDAHLLTRGTIGDGQQPDYDSPRMGAQIGAGLIAAELNELTAAMVEARDPSGQFDIHKWGREGMTHLTPLWLLKYLPNMLACHVTIIHDTQGPSNTITCGEASSGLSVGESLRVIQRGAADLCFCGGTDSKLNPMAFLRQLMTGRLNTSDNHRPQQAVRPFCQTAAGAVVGEGGGIVILESLETFQRRRARAAPSAQPRAYAEILGFGASQTVHPESGNILPDPQGRGIGLAIRAAMAEAHVSAEQIDLIVPTGLGLAASDQAEAAILRAIFGDRLQAIPVVCGKPYVGNCGAGAGALDLCLAAMVLQQQQLPAVINCDQPLDGLHCRTAPPQRINATHALTFSAGMGGQNAALVLRRLDA